MKSYDQPIGRKSENNLPLASEFCRMELRERLARSPAKDAGHAEFLAYMSYEMRTPLTAILGYTQTIKLSTEYPELDLKHDEYIDHIDVSAQHLLTVIQSMLSYLEDVCALDAARKARGRS